MRPEAAAELRPAAADGRAQLPKSQACGALLRGAEVLLRRCPAPPSLP